MGSVTPLSALSPPLNQSLEHFVRRLAIVNLATAPALQHRGHGDGHLPEPIRQLLLDQPQQSPTIASFLGSPSGEGLDDPPELVQPPAPAATGAEHGDRAAAGEVEQVANLRLGPPRPGQVGLVDDDHVGDLQEPGLLPLEFVSGLRLNEEDQDVDQVPDGRIPLTHPGRQ